MDTEARALAHALRQLVEEVLDPTETEESAGPDKLRAVVDAHLGAPSVELPVVRESVPDHQFVDLDVALTRLAERGGGEDVVGISGGDQRLHQGLADLLAGHFGVFGVGAVDRLNLPTGPDSSRRVVGFGLRLLHWEGHAMVVLQRNGSQHSDYSAGFEVVCADGDLVAPFIEDVRRTMLEHSVLRGQVLSFSGSPWDPENAGITFLRRPDVAAEDVILPAGSLERIARHIVGIGAQAVRLRRSGQHLKRGVLLYGPPGTGKTHTVRHLVGRAVDCTVVLLSGQSLGLVTAAAHLARAMQPAIVVLEDCDLIAEDRGIHPGERPLLFELLDAMDGLDGDADVAFLLTSNRADLIERALAERPGRVDLAIEIPLPDRDQRLALFRLYATGLPISDDVLARAADRADGVTASFAKELLRRAVLRAAELDRDVSDDDVLEALAELLSDAEQLTRSLLGSGPATVGPGDREEGEEDEDTDWRL